MASDSRHLQLDRIVGPFAELLLATDLPQLSPQRRAEVVQFVQRRARAVPSFTRFGVTVIGLFYRGLIAATRRTRGRSIADVETASGSRRVSAADPLARIRLHLGALARHITDRSAAMIAVAATTQMDAEVLVIGSGAGGATTAAVLAEAGFDVLIVEEGEWVEQGAVVPFSLEQMDRQYRSGGVTVALGLPSIAYTEGRCAGGGTEINSGSVPAPTGRGAWSDGRIDFGIADLDQDEVGSIADEVERAINVTTVPGPPTAPSDVLRRGAEALGWQNSEIPRWMKYADNDPAKGQRQSMTRTYLPRAVDAGATTGHRLSHRCVGDEWWQRQRGPRRRWRTAAGATSGFATSSCAAARSSRRRCCSGPASPVTSADRWRCIPPSSSPPDSPTS